MGDKTLDVLAVMAKDAALAEERRIERGCSNRKVAANGASEEARIAVAELIEAAEAAMPIIDAYRRVSGGDGDLSAARLRAALAAVRGDA